ncbi:hypothetical protein, partial [Escherichia coli]|uniref:hypothetical protein n=1 Tax=Escherichia coli TaxID=562 RepID=UPI0019648C60
TVIGPGSDGGSDSASGDSGNGNDSATNDSGNGNDSGGGPDAAACPDESGAYTVMLSGQGCGDANANTSQCIKQMSCDITFSSVAPNPNSKTALNGMAAIAIDGSFMNAAIKEGTVNRTGCVGVWDGTKQTLTIDCGGVNTSQSCRAVLTRTKALCN